MPDAEKNSGFTLIELVVSMAILGVLGISIGGFLYAGMKQYHAASAEVTLQTEAQMAQNQLSNLLLDANRAVAYSPGKLEIFSVRENVSEKEQIQLYYDAGEEKIFYSRYLLQDESPTDSTQVWKEDADAQEESFAAYVTGFTVTMYDKAETVLTDADRGKEIGKMKLTISYEVNGKTYDSEFVVTPRNSVIFSDAESMKAM